MAFSNSYFPEKRFNFEDEKVVHLMVKILDTYSPTNFIKEDEIQKKIKKDLFGSWRFGSLQLSLSFRVQNFIELKVNCPEFDINFKYEANEEFKNGYIYFWINEKHGEAVKKAFLDFMDALKNDICASWANKVIYDENNKPFILVDLSYHGVHESSGDHYNIYVTDKGIQWGVSGPPQMTMSAVGGAGGTCSFKDFMDGKLHDFILRYEGIETLNEIKKNIRLRIENP